MNEEKDIRYQRTRGSIYNGLQELLKNESFENISVKDIIEKAEVSRSAFYNHFEDKYQLVENYQNSFIKKLNKFVSKSRKSGRHETMLQVLFILKEEEALLCSLLGKNGSVELQRQFLQALRRNAEENFIPLLDVTLENQVEKNYFLTFISNALFAIVQEWIDGGQSESPEELISVIDKLIKFDYKK